MDQATLEYIKNDGQDIISKVTLDDQRRGRVPKKKSRNKNPRVQNTRMEEQENLERIIAHQRELSAEAICAPILSLRPLPLSLFLYIFLLVLKRFREKKKINPDKDN